MLRALRLGAGPILFRAKSYRGQNAPSVSQTRFAPFVGARKRNAVRPAWAQAKRPVCLTGMLRALCLGAGPILFRAKSYRGQNAPSVSQTRFAPFVDARKRNVVRPAWAQAKRPVCLAGMLRALRLGAGPIPARETLQGAKRPVRLANALRALRWRAKTKRCAARLGAGKAPCLSYRHAPRPSPGRGAYPAPRETLQGAKRPVCLANALRALR